MKHMRDVLMKVSWPLLAEQKLALIELNCSSISFWEPEIIDGLINFIDSIQDAAEKDGFPVIWSVEDNKNEPESD